MATSSNRLAIFGPRDRLSPAHSRPDVGEGGLEPERKASLVISKPPSPSLPQRSDAGRFHSEGTQLISAQGATLLRGPQSAPK
jgi:hypothetical protein